MSDRLITVTEEVLKVIVEKSFDKGEEWGNTCSSWFKPAKEDMQKKKDDAFDTIMTAIKLYDKA